MLVRSNTFTIEYSGRYYIKFHLLSLLHISLFCILLKLLLSIKTAVHKDLYCEDKQIMIVIYTVAQEILPNMKLSSVYKCILYLNMFALIEWIVQLFNDFFTLYVIVLFGGP